MHGDKWTIITGDQAAYKLAVVIRDKQRGVFPRTFAPGRLSPGTELCEGNLQDHQGLWCRRSSCNSWSVPERDSRQDVWRESRLLPDYACHQNPPDMLLRQTYNADAKEKSGLGGITLSEAARTKWVSTKPVTASISAELKSMLRLTTSNPHHKSGPTRVARDGEIVLKVIAAIDTNPFSATMTALVNRPISTKQHADPVVQEHITGVKELGLNALSCSIYGDQKKTKVVKLKTFHTQNVKPKRSTVHGVTGKSDEVTALLRITQINASGGDVNVVNFIGKHQCSKVPPALFNEDGTIRAAGTKASLVKILKEEETKVTTADMLPHGDLKTAVVVDALHAIRRWSFEKNETFGDISDRYKKQLLKDVPAGKKIIHFCYD